MLNDLNISDVLFLDIETVPCAPDFNSLNDRMKKLWEKKAMQLSKNEVGETADSLFGRAGIYAEFGKVVCVSCGFHNGREFRIKSFYGHDERLLLEGFGDMLESHFNERHHLLCAHNGKEFDFPFLARRMLVDGLALPDILNLAGKKPWEVRHLDTMELWKFGDYKHYTSLELLAAIFDIPTPKDDIDGSMVGRVYWEDDDVERIATYCQKDVVTIAQLMRKYLGMDLMDDSDVTLV